jgi:hypothetical protein
MLHRRGPLVLLSLLVGLLPAALQGTICSTQFHLWIRDRFF